MALNLFYGVDPGTVIIFADGVSTEIKIDLDNLPPRANGLPPQGVPVSIVGVTINSSSPVPPFTSALQGKFLVITFATPPMASGPGTSGLYGVAFNLLF